MERLQAAQGWLWWLADVSVPQEGALGLWPDEAHPAGLGALWAAGAIQTLVTRERARSPA